MAQRKYCAALLAWVRTTTYVPADFPKPSGQDLAQLRPGPNGSTDAEASFAGLASDWNKVPGAESQVVPLPAWHCSHFLLLPLGKGAPCFHSPHHHPPCITRPSQQTPAGNFSAGKSHFGGAKPRSGFAST